MASISKSFRDNDQELWVQLGFGAVQRMAYRDENGAGVARLQRWYRFGVDVEGSGTPVQVRRPIIDVEKAKESNEALEFVDRANQ